jgi:hypothetical protein
LTANYGPFDRAEVFVACKTCSPGKTCIWSAFTDRWGLARYLYRPPPRTTAQTAKPHLRDSVTVTVSTACAASMAASVAAHLPLRAPARVGAAPSRPSVADVARFRGRTERRGLAAAAPRGGRRLAGLRAEAVSGGSGGGGGRREPMVPPYNVLITGSTKGGRSSVITGFPFEGGRFCISEFMLIKLGHSACNLNSNRRLLRCLNECSQSRAFSQSMVNGTLTSKFHNNR